MTDVVFVCTFDKECDTINYILDIFNSMPTRQELDSYLRHNYSLMVIDYSDITPGRYITFKCTYITDKLLECVRSGNIVEHTIANHKQIDYY